MSQSQFLSYLQSLPYPCPECPYFSIDDDICMLPDSLDCPVLINEV